MINTDLIKNIRVGMGKSPYQFASYLGMDQKTYEAIEKGESVTLNSLKKVAEKFNLPLSSLIKD